MTFLRPAAWASILTCILIIVTSCRPAADTPNSPVERPRVDAPLALPATQSTDYVVEPGDTLELKFFYQPELNDTLVIRPDGRSPRS